MAKIKLAFISEVDLDDITALSGTSYKIKRAFEKRGVNVIKIDNLNKNKSLRSLYVRLLSVINRKILKRNFKDYWTRVKSKDYSKAAMKKLRNEDFDIIFTWHTPILSYLKINKPKVLYTDANINLLIDFYPDFYGFSDRFVKRAQFITKNALENATIAAFSSDWASNSAIKDYNISPEKVKTITLGCNIDHNLKNKEIDHIIDNRDQNEIQLLFIGVDWKRKGGEKAYDILNYIAKLEQKVKLHIIGIKNIENQLKNNPNVIHHGFINKGTPDGKKKMEDIFKSIHFLVLPTKADCTPMVFAELNSFGVPAISHDIGGISSIIINDVNGKTFPIDADAEHIGNTICQLFNNKATYRKLAKSSFNEYEARLNWDYTADKLLKEIQEILLPTGKN